jgi:tRNA(Leu) C34 or U34 (ribose-2'-O)-methylase TrmL
MSETHPTKQDTRNVVDYLKYWTDFEINQHLDEKRHPFGVLCCNLFGDFNLATIVRNNNAFLAKEVFIYGHKKWDRRGAVGCHHYSHISHLPTENDLDKITGYTWVGIDNIKSAVPIDTFTWPKNSLLCFGEEHSGLPQEVIKRCQHIVYIRQFGSVRSLNVGSPLLLPCMISQPNLIKPNPLQQRSEGYTEMMKLAVVAFLILSGCSGIPQEAYKQANDNSLISDAFVVKMEKGETTRIQEQAIIRAYRRAWHAQNYALNNVPVPVDMLVPGNNGPLDQNLLQALDSDLAVRKAQRNLNDSFNRGEIGDVNTRSR